MRGGAEGDRTPDLRIANAALSQLSYCPSEGAGLYAVAAGCQADLRSAGYAPSFAKLV
jgi:hypothetical protein